MILAIYSCAFIIEINFNENPSNELIHYIDNSRSKSSVRETNFTYKGIVDKPINIPFLNITIHLKPDANSYENTEYYIKFEDFNNVVSRYKSLDVSVNSKAAAVVSLQMQGSNKYRLVEYLNTTVEVLKKNQLDNNNLFATNTIKFIDSTLLEMEGQIKETEAELDNFRKNKNIFELETGGERLTQQLSELDIEKDILDRKIKYLNHLKNYLEKSNDFSKLPAPSVAGIDDPNILTNVSKLISLSQQRAELGYSVKSTKMFSEFDAEMSAVKKILLENIANTKSAISIDFSAISRRMSKAEGLISNLPEQKQDLLKITRKYNLKDNIYSTFLQKRSEAEIVKAANVSDVDFIDSAKDIGGGLMGPKTGINYVLAALMGFLIPIVIIFIFALLDNNLNSIEDIQKQTNIPIIGVIGKKNTENNLSVFEKQKSPLAESFRAIRSSLQFMYKKQKEKGAKILMITSSVSGEGKTFCSINLATVFALSGKKTVIVGLDLRKPRIFGDFNIDNLTGVVNYLIGQKTIEDVTQVTHIPFLDLITSGPIPPNPSELLMGESMEELIEDLKKKYDYIILDTPPIGLVADALELAKFCDATLYVSRQGFTKKEMLSVVNEKYKRGELNNVSVVFNGFQNKSKYGYGNGYGYGYGVYGEAYHDDVEEIKGWKKIFSKFQRNKA